MIALKDNRKTLFITVFLLQDSGSYVSSTAAFSRSSLPCLRLPPRRLIAMRRPWSRTENWMHLSLRCCHSWQTIFCSRRLWRRWSSWFVASGEATQPLQHEMHHQSTAKERELFKCMLAQRNPGL